MSTTPTLIPRLQGAERFHLGAAGPTEHTILDMWRWTASDLLSNTARGLVAEWLVAVVLSRARNRTKVDPLDLRQWKFYVLATRVLDRAVSTQKTITLSSLLRLRPAEAAFGGIAAAVETCSGAA